MVRVKYYMAGIKYAMAIHSELINIGPVIELIIVIVWSGGPTHRDRLIIDVSRISDEL